MNMLRGQASWLVCFASLVFLAAADAPRSVAAQDMVETMPSEVSAAESSDAGQGEVKQIFKAVIVLVISELEQGEHQGAIAVLAFVFGCFLMFNGKECFNYLIVAGTAYLLAVMVMDSLGGVWGLARESNLRHFIGMEAAVIGAWATWKGIKGFDVYTFAFFGFVVARTTQHWLTNIGLHAMDTDGGNKWLILVYYTIVVIVFLYLAEGRAHKLFIVVVTPAMGALLIISAVAYAITEYCVNPVLGIHIFGFLEKIWPNVTPVTGAWVRFLQTICSQTAKDYGIFAGSPYGPANQKFSLDRIVGWTFCFLLYCVGVYVQKKLNPPDTDEDDPEEEEAIDNESKID